MKADLEQQLQSWAGQARSVGDPPPMELPTERQRHQVRAWLAAGAASTAAIVALIIWAAGGGSSNSGVSSVVPASTPSVPTLTPNSREAVDVPIPVGQRTKSPPLSGITLASGHFDLAEYRGNVVVVSFGGSWCAPCRSQIQTVKSLADAYAERRGPKTSEVIFVGVDEHESSASGYAFYKGRANVGFPVVVDTGNKIGSAWNGTNSQPYTVILDRQGRIAEYISGQLAGPSFQAAVDRIANEAAATPSAGSPPAAAMTQLHASVVIPITRTGRYDKQILEPGIHPGFNSFAASYNVIGGTAQFSAQRIHPEDGPDAITVLGIHFTVTSFSGTPSFVLRSASVQNVG